MAGLSVATITKAIQTVIAPEMQVVKDRLAFIEGEIKSRRSEISRPDDKIDNLKKSSARKLRAVSPEFKKDSPSPINAWTRL